MRKPTTGGSLAAPVIASPSSSADLKRRRFLVTLGVGGAGAAAAAVAVLPGAVVAQDAANGEDETGSGYRETQHVRDYYRTAKL